MPNTTNEHGQQAVEPFRLPHDPSTVALKKREIAARYRAGRSYRAVTGELRIMRFRRRDLQNIFRARYGDTLPDNAIGRDLIYVLAQTVAGGGGALATGGHARHLCPWMTEDALEALTERVLAHPRRWTADALGKRLRLSDAERTALGVTTIGAYDVPKAERLARRRELNHAAKTAKRRAAGARPRVESAARTRPWAALGMSRRTWYRHGKPAVAQVRVQHALKRHCCTRSRATPSEPIGPRVVRAELNPTFAPFFPRPRLKAPGEVRVDEKPTLRRHRGVSSHSKSFLT
jgi:hypothetical protein